MPLPLVGLSVALVGVAVASVALLALRASDARPGLGRRLAGAPEVRVGRLLDAAPLPRGDVRVAGRIRCREPLHADGGERLVAFHRDVEVHIDGRWRALERLRETRSFELWDHDGSLTVDPAQAAEPLVSIPNVWRGDPSELEEPHASGMARLADRLGPPTKARAVTRTINVTDRLLVLARLATDPVHGVRLDPPEGGFVISNLALDDAMRLLGGRHRRVAAITVIGLALGVALAAVGIVGALGAALLAG